MTFNPETIDRDKAVAAIRKLRAFRGTKKSNAAFKLNEIVKAMVAIGFTDVGPNRGSKHQFHHVLLEEARHLTQDGLFETHFKKGGARTPPLVFFKNYKGWMWNSIEYVIDELLILRPDIRVALEE